MDFHSCKQGFVVEPLRDIDQNDCFVPKSLSIPLDNVTDEDGYYCVENNDILQTEDIGFHIAPMSEAFSGHDSSNSSTLGDELSLRRQEEIVPPLSVGEIFDGISNEANFVEGGTEVNLEDIQLYLECSDDNVPMNDTLHTDLSTKTKVAEATSQIKMDTQFKISFPLVPEKSLNCSLCNRVFISKRFLREHSMASHSDIFKFCTFCPYFTKSRKFFQTHMTSKHKQTSILSGEVGNEPTLEEIKITFTFPGPSDETVGGVILSETVEPILMFDNASKLKDHQQIGDNVAECLVIRKTCSNIRNISDDVVETEVKCELCNFVTKSNRLISYHKKAVHNKHRELFRCQQCTYCCKQKKSFDAHKKKHEGLFEFCCTDCNKKFASKHLLTKHCRIHRQSLNIAENSERKSSSGVVIVSRSTQTKLARRKK